MAKDTIVVADDDQVLVAMVAAFLRQQGFNVIPAFDAMQAMIGARSAPKAVILDIGMPGGTGLDVIRKLKAMTKTSQIPLLVLTASTDPAMEREARSLGADEFLAKPVDLGVLHEARIRAMGA